MLIEIKVPSPGESITEVVIARWLKKDGDVVRKDEELCEIDSDKATLTVNAEDSGAIKILAKEGDTVKVGAAICTIDNSVAPSAAVAPKTEIKAVVTETKKPETVAAKTETYAKDVPSPAAKKLMDEKELQPSQITSSGKDGRITKGDVLNA